MQAGIASLPGFMAQFIEKTPMTATMEAILATDILSSGGYEACQDRPMLELDASAKSMVYPTGKGVTKAGILRVVKDTVASIIGDASLQGTQ